LKPALAYVANMLTIY